MQPGADYRADVDGLRAVAIVPVLLFHAGVPGFAGGYLGVDVFFVISGYLITSLIRAQMVRGEFSVLGFYERRIRRILPALFAVMLVSFAAALLLLRAEDLTSFARSAVATALFASNFHFWQDAGYFSAPAEFKPLLHTWSLAVEEQFYILFPALLALAGAWSTRRLAAVVSGIALLSFVGGLAMAARSPEAAFYLAPFRAWELMLGALAGLGALAPLRQAVAREITALAGLLLIVAGMAGAGALSSCLGTLLLIHAGDMSRVARILSLRPLVFIGLISYSLYLWHWPLLAFLKYALLRELHGAEVAAALVMSFVLAALSWKYIEQPFRASAGMPRRRLFALAGGASAFVLVAGAAAIQSAGWPGRFDEPARAQVRGREDYRAGNCFLEETQTFADWGRKGSCLIDNGAKRTVLLWGDSFAAHYVPGLATAASYNYVQFTAYSCPPVLGARIAWAPGCRDINDQLETVLRGQPFAAVIVAARWERYWGTQFGAAELERTLRLLRERKLPVVLVGQGPSFGFPDPVAYVQQTRRPAAESKDATALNRELRKVSGYGAFFDPNEFLCPANLCLLRDGEDYLYWDAGHYSSHGSRRIAPRLVEAINAAIRP